MPRDDWKYDEEMWDEGGEEEQEKIPTEKQCVRCHHWVPYDTTYCSWCGELFEKRDRR